VDFTIVGRMSGFDEKTQPLADQSMLLYAQIATDYYKRIHTKFVSKKHSVTINFLTLINNTSTKVDISMSDQDYFEQKLSKSHTDAVSLNLSIYKINLTNNTYSILSFVEGESIN
jgi:hypothetical protein